VFGGVFGGGVWWGLMFGVGVWWGGGGGGVW